MADFLFILKFFGGIIIFFVIGGLVGHLLKLVNYFDDKLHDHNEVIQRDNNYDDRNEKK